MGRAKSILVAYDGSDAAHRALDAAADLMGYGSVVAVVGATADGAPDADPLSGARDHMIRRHVFARYVHADGHLAARLLETAGEIGAELLVVGRENGVVDTVIAGAPCDVLVVR